MHLSPSFFGTTEGKVGAGNAKQWRQIANCMFEISFRICLSRSRARRMPRLTRNTDLVVFFLC